MFYVYDNRNGKAEGPYSRGTAKNICSDMNDRVQKKLSAEDRKNLRARDQRPFTFGTKDDFAKSGKLITK